MYPWQRERGRICPERVAGGDDVNSNSAAGSYGCVEAYRIRDIENFPGELDILPFGDAPRFSQTCIDVEKSISPVCVALPRFARVRQTQRKTALDAIVQRGWIRKSIWRSIDDMLLELYRTCLHHAALDLIIRSPCRGNNAKWKTAAPA